MNDRVLLSICIPTLNRGDLIGETLDSIVSQLTSEVEVVIVDGGSADDTEAIVGQYAKRHRNLRYVKKNDAKATPSNEGFDRDCNLAVELAYGEYCWLMTDDDLIRDGAVAEILQQIPESPSLIIACAEVRDVDLSNVLIESQPVITANTRYDRGRWNEFVTEVGPHLTFVGRVVIRRSVWRSRHPGRYFGTGFIHAAVILSEPLESIFVLARPLIVIRYGNGLWRPRAFDIWMFQWPELIWSMNSLSDEAKRAVTERHPFKNVRRLLWYRALGAYSVEAYRTRLSSEPPGYRLIAATIARLPRVVSNAICWVYFAPIRSRPVRMALYDLLHCGHAAPFAKHLARLRGVY